MVMMRCVNRCVTGGTVPILTQLIVQCQGANQIDIQPVTNLGSVLLPGEDGGAGVYRCGTSGSWEPLFGSPFLNELTKSCTNAGCGRVPHPGRNIHVHRRWSWVRALISQGEVRCTATLVSPTAAITAAHCLTRSLVSRQALDVRNFQLELPGPDELNPRIRVTPQSLHIHPRYLPQIGYQHDLAVITFRALDYALPTVCLAHNQLMPSDANTQVVFKLDQSLAIFDVVSPSWRTSEANWFNSCQGLANPASSCQTQPVVNPSQFCASHPGLSMVAGSSGGPYLAEISKGVEEVWVLVGILSQFTNETSCDQSHTIYTQVADGTKWVRSCVFDGKCN
ncbi:Serine protease 45-like 2 [Homarus americanus]|uniref:Serine protease 45-like 2 n=1 Tax=Homarus americanus TaxID=6706 RepID=A0A8J5T2G3_HOMAM|nr:Serine protease 45-like 2 [Homarus americanus]